MRLLSIPVCCLLISLFAQTILGQTPIQREAKVNRERQGIGSLSTLSRPSPTQLTAPKPLPAPTAQPLPKPQTPVQAAAASKPATTGPAKSTIDVESRRKEAVDNMKARLAEASEEVQQAPSRTDGASPSKDFRKLSLTKAENDRIGQTVSSLGSPQLAASRLSLAAPIQVSTGSLILYFGEGYVILFGFRYNIVNGQITFDGKQFVVCHYSIGLATEFFCCGAHLFPVTSQAGGLSCCNGVYYHTATETCCNGQFYIKKISTSGHPQQCCGQAHVVPLDNEVCCGNLPYPSTTTGCCGNIAYLLNTYCCVAAQRFPIGSANCGSTPPGTCTDTATTKCCGQNRYAILPGHVCCGSIYYSQAHYRCCANGQVVYGSQTCPGGGQCTETVQHKCCLNNAYARLPGYLCCGSSYISPIFHRCCNNVPCTSQDPCLDPTIQCCGGLRYPRTLGYVCCGASYIQSIAQTCCGNVPCAPTNPCLIPTNICCSGQAHPRQSNHVCCGTSYINSFFQECCPNGEVKPRGQCVSQNPCLDPNHICCGSQVFPRQSTHVCCGTSYINSFFQECCPNGEVKPKGQCVSQNPCLDPNHICCASQVHPRQSFHVCCGTSYINSIFQECCPNGEVKPKGQCIIQNPCLDPNNQCCSGQVHARIPNYVCCGTSYINLISQTCCGNVPCVVIQDPCQDPNNQCCGGQVHSKKQFYQCCGTSYFHSIFQECCTNGEIKLKGQCIIQNPCLDPNNQCCSGQVHKRIPNYVCCGTSYINLISQTCCGNVPCVVIQDPCQDPNNQCCAGQVHSKKPFYQCCGTSYFHSIFQECCTNGEVKTAGQCVSQNSCNDANHVCCGNTNPLPRVSGYSCCGTSYINDATQGCCDLVSYFKNTQECCTDWTIKLKGTCISSNTCSSPSVKCCNGSPIQQFMECCALTTPYNTFTQQCCPNGQVVAKGGPTTCGHSYSTGK